MISGRSGVALVMDGDRFASIHASDPERWIPRRVEELHFLLGEGEDFVPVEDVTRDEIVHRLLLARKSEDALHLALIAQDPEMPDSLRRRAVKNLERLLQEGEVGNALEGVLYAQPLPPGLDVAGAMRHAREAEALEVQTLLELLWTYQAQIREVREAWEVIPQELFEDQADHWQATAVREGVFRDLARCRASDGVNDFFAEVHVRPAIQGLSNYRVVLQSWLNSLLKKDVTPTWEATEFLAAEASFVYEEERPYGEPKCSPRSFDRQTTKPLLLVVDDDPDIRELASIALTHMGYEVVLAENGWEGLKRFEERTHDFVAVILGSVMPGMGGEEALERMLKIRPDLPAVIVGGENTSKTRFETTYGIVFLEKPLKIDQLVKKLGEISSL